MSFDIMRLQKGRGPVKARSKADEGCAMLKYIDVDDLVPSEDNFYSMTAIEELASLIELSGGVKQPALVVPLGGGKYKVIAGHRRRLASLQLVKQGKEKYRKMPCMVEEPPDVETADAAEAEELWKIDEAILLITTNGQREKTDWDKVQEATTLRALLERKRRFEKIPGETRKLIAEQLGTTPAQVGRYDSINKHLLQVFKDWLAEGKIGISVAYELSTLPEDVQRDAAGECWGKSGPITLEDVRKWKLSAERDPLPPGEITVLAADETGPAPTPEQIKQLLERDRPDSGAVVLPEKLEDEAGAPKVRWERTPEQERTETETVDDGGKVVHFPAPPSPTPAPPAEDGREKKDMEWAALMLKTLRDYCAVRCMEGESQPWADYAEALAIAIPVLRK